MIKLVDILTEGVYDPGIFKAVFTAGGPGSGKSYAASTLFGMPEKMPFVSAAGLKGVNTDSAFKTFLNKAGLNTDLASINKAWVVFSANGHIMNSENVSSINHAQLGEYQITWGKSFTASYGVTFGDVTPADARDASVRGFRGFPSAATGITVTYIAYNPSAVAKEDIMGTIAAWEV